MALQEITIDNADEQQFQTGEIMTIVSGHFVHDSYTAMIPVLLPVIIEKLSLSLTAVGSLTALLQLPALLNPFIGYLADRISLRYFIILAPAITGTIISSLGFASGYFELAIMLFVTGFSVAAFHAPAPAMIGRISGNQVGKGMSYFMASGELSRTVGPLIAVWAITTWTLDGIYRLAIFGWIASLVLFWRLRAIPARSEPAGSPRAILPALRTLYLPLLTFVLFRNFLNVSLTTYLPTFMKSQGSTLLIAGAALSILELAGVAGALLSGTLSDRLGRKPILLIATMASVIFMLIFLSVDGWLLVPVLLALGFTTLSTTPVLMAIVQEQLPNHRALANGLFLSMALLLRSFSLLVFGYLGDSVGLEAAYLISALLSLLAIPAIFIMPQVQSTQS